jgi:hypothetical protein
MRNEAGVLLVALITKVFNSGDGSVMYSVTVVGISGLGPVLCRFD